MLRSLFSAISGLQAHQTKMDVVGNNIANVNTVGYKASNTVFEDTLSQLLRNGSAPAGDTAGTNPAQVGLGVKVAEITTNFSQGSTQSTGRASDFMISGDGFFVTKSGNEDLYTRAGSFDIDGSGKLVTPDGSVLQGWMATGGSVNTNGPIEPLSIPFGQVLPPASTTDGSTIGNLSADAKPGDPAVQTQATMYDALGNPHAVSYIFSNTGPNAWQVDVKAVDASGATVSLSGGPQPMTFNPTSNPTGAPAGAIASGGTITFSPAATFPSWPGTVTVDLSKMTQFGGKSTATATPPTTGAGSALGTLETYSLGSDGTITGVYSNGLRQAIGQLALANFSNPNGLTKAGSSSYRVGDNSGTAAIGVAGSGGRGTLAAGALEMSNVDLGQEFTGLIIAQRGFQANSKVITTSDQILQDLVQMKQ
jgi:flagellar hook protein FlgE